MQSKLITTLLEEYGEIPDEHINSLIEKFETWKQEVKTDNKLKPLPFTKTELDYLDSDLLDNLYTNRFSDIKNTYSYACRNHNLCLIEWLKEMFPTLNTQPEEKFLNDILWASKDYPQMPSFNELTTSPLFIDIRDRGFNAIMDGSLNLSKLMEVSSRLVNTLTESEATIAVKDNISFINTVLERRGK